MIKKKNEHFLNRAIIFIPLDPPPGTENYLLLPQQHSPEKVQGARRPPELARPQRRDHHKLLDALVRGRVDQVDAPLAVDLEGRGDVQGLVLGGADARDDAEGRADGGPDRVGLGHVELDGLETLGLLVGFERMEG